MRNFEIWAVTDEEGWLEILYEPERIHIGEEAYFIICSGISRYPSSFVARVREVTRLLNTGIYSGIDAREFCKELLG